MKRLFSGTARDVVVIQIDEADAQIAQVIVEAGAGEQVFDVAAVARPFADDNFARARLQERRRRRRRRRADGC